MLEKISGFFVYCFRGGAYAAILMALSLCFFFLSRWLYSADQGSSLTIMSNYIAQGILWLGMGLWAAAVVVWLATWLSDYRSDYLPNWVRRELY